MELGFDWDHDVVDQKISWQMPKVNQAGMRNKTDGTGGIDNATTDSNAITRDVFGGQTHDAYH